MILQELGLKHNTDKATYHKYLDFYQKHLPKRTFAGRLLEIGVMDGGSMRMWREYYPKADIIGVDNAMQANLQIDGVGLVQLDATNPIELKELGMFDIIIDDGSHKTADQQASFEHLFYNQLTPGGLYIIEDLHTSFMDSYINSDQTTVDYLKKLKKIKITHFSNNEKESMTCIIKPL